MRPRRRACSRSCSIARPGAEPAGMPLAVTFPSPGRMSRSGRGR
jgi:hypothetical protein